MLLKGAVTEMFGTVRMATHEFILKVVSEEVIYERPCLT